MLKILFFIIFVTHTFCAIAGSTSDIKDAKVTEVTVIGDAYYVKARETRLFSSSIRHQLRLAGIATFSAVEFSAEANIQALKYMRDKLIAKRFDIEYDTKMKAWVLIRRNRSFNQDLIKEGLVKRQDDAGKYLRAEKTAKVKKNGIWKIRQDHIEQEIKAQKAFIENQSLLDKSDMNTLNEQTTLGTQASDEALFRQALNEMPPANSSQDIIAKQISTNKTLYVPNNYYVMRQHRFVPEALYSILIKGSDYYYERFTSPRALYVYTLRKNKPIFYIILGLDYKNVGSLRPYDSISIDCIYIKNINVKINSKYYNAPVFKYSGNTTMYDVGGTLLYYQ